mmetsp:Transcript_27622/g.20030  ORF Transcript_27622/g.20030 Transcript_27622/m.20030 type:complete len:86 (+) Transcript_27622:119-376(+)
MFYIMSIKFEIKSLTEACEDIIVKNFEEIETDIAEKKDFLLDLPPEYFISLCNHNDLNIHHEALLAEIIQKYLKHRENPDSPDEE